MIIGIADEGGIVARMPQPGRAIATAPGYYRLPIEFVDLGGGFCTETNSKDQARYFINSPKNIVDLFFPHAAWAWQCFRCCTKFNIHEALVDAVALSAMAAMVRGAQVSCKPS